MADVPLLNSTATLTGKTAVTQEGTHTVTGPWTFDRDPNAPIIVTAASAKVDNLDADKLDGQEGSYYLSAANHTGDWTAYVPTWTASAVNPALGNGTLSGRYFQIGKLVFFDIALVMGGTTTFGTGNYSWALPVPAADTDGQVVAAQLRDTGTNYYAATGRPATVNTVQLAANATNFLVGTAVPFTFADTDEIHISGFYVAA